MCVCVCVCVRLSVCTNPFADGDGLLGHGLGVGDMVLHDGLEQLVLILPVKRRLEEQEEEREGREEEGERWRERGERERGERGGEREERERGGIEKMR